MITPDHFHWVTTVASKAYCSHRITKILQTPFQTAGDSLWSRSPDRPMHRISSPTFRTITGNTIATLTVTTTATTICPRRNERHARRASARFQKSTGRHCKPSTSSTATPCWVAPPRPLQPRPPARPRKQRLFLLHPLSMPQTHLAKNACSVCRKPHRNSHPAALSSLGTSPKIRTRRLYALCSQVCSLTPLPPRSIM